ncbi:unnamed protein product [Schistosoma mattheei]|uniref:Uncharacterized protein n=1 Tax=Schistosoma mattheei TaxID=31246 RepID=A0A183Q0L7_9TREM|nr:unnamed protein product [Schistosoma mattheei]
MMRTTTMTTTTRTRIKKKKNPKKNKYNQYKHVNYHNQFIYQIKLITIKSIFNQIYHIHLN